MVVPDANALPPVEAEYQSMVYPAPGLFTEIVTDPVPHLEAPVAPVGAAGSGSIVAVTAVLVAEIQVVAAILL